METVTRKAPLVGPHAEEPPARLIEAGGDVYVLVGGLLQQEGAAEDDPFKLLVAPGVTRDFDADFLPMMGFFQVARTEQQAREWLAWAGAPDDGLKDLVDTGVVVKVNTRNPWTAAKSLKGARIIPQSVPGEASPDHETLVAVHRVPGSAVEGYVPVELAYAMWGLETALDIPTVVKRFARESGERRDLTARRLITNIPRILPQGLARLEWVSVDAATAH